MEMSIAESRETAWKPSLYYTIYGLFYFAQGLAMTAGPLWIPVYLREVFHLSPAVVTSTWALAMLPWYVKIIYGILSDAVPIGRFGRRRPYIAIGALLSLVGWALLPVLPWGGLWVAAMLIMMLGVGVSDSVIDGLALDVVPGDRRGTMLGIGWGARGVGAVVAGLVGGLIVGQVGYGSVFVMAGFVSAILTLGCLIIKEPPVAAERRITRAALADTFKSKALYLGLVFLPLTVVPLGMIMILLGSYAREMLKLSVEMTGAFAACFYLGNIIGAPLAGGLGDRLGHKRVFYFYMPVWGVFIMLMALSQVAPLPLAFLLVGLTGLGFGLQTGGTLAIAGDLTPRALAATMFALYMSFMNIGTGFGSAASGFVVQTYGYGVNFVLAALSTLLPLIVLYFLPLPVAETQSDSSSTLDGGSPASSQG
jgi:PAT family beta-lactamase induction signal transducer AmpG